jgi:hypothetical protein
MTCPRLAFLVSLGMTIVFVARDSCAVESRQSLVLQGNDKVGKVRATLLVNSGEPDPTWELGEAAIKSVQNLLKDLPQAKKSDWQEPGGLGYRGIRLISEKVGGFPHAVHVYRGLIEVKTGDKVEYFKVTKEKDLEKFLVDMHEKSKNTM